MDYAHLDLCLLLIRNVGRSVRRLPRTGVIVLRKFPIKSLLSLSAFIFLIPVCSHAQVRPAAQVHEHSIYVGGEYSLYNSDYFGDNKSLNRDAFSIYGDYEIWSGAWPISVDVNYTRVVGQGNDDSTLSSIMAGPKVSHRFGRWEPFGKVGAGVGYIIAPGLPYVAQYGHHFAIGFGGGLEYRLTNHIMLRPIDYTYERWNFSPHALSPSILGFGLAYRFH